MGGEGAITVLPEKFGSRSEMPTLGSSGPSGASARSSWPIWMPINYNAYLMFDPFVSAGMVLLQTSAADARDEYIGSIVGFIVGVVAVILVAKKLSGSRAPSGATVESPLQSAQGEKRRLARLLVSEIRLRNAREVDEGRRRHDLAVRFDNELRRSYRTFVERCGEDGESTGIFREEVVKILAAGDESALGNLQLDEYGAALRRS